MKDTLFKTPSTGQEKFNFGERTAIVFNDMLRRSVPHYDEIQQMICNLTLKFAQENSNVYDLGCSTGNTLKLLITALSRTPVKIIGIDLSTAMLKRASTRLSKAHRNGKCELHKMDLNEPLQINNASVVIANLTLQFIRPSRRKKLVSSIYAGLRPGGALILVEKIVQTDARITETFIVLYHELKRKKGYSQQEIQKKQNALRRVLIPQTFEKNNCLLSAAGFRTTEEFFRWYNFCGIIALK